MTGIGAKTQHRETARPRGLHPYRAILGAVPPTLLAILGAALPMLAALAAAVPAGAADLTLHADLGVGGKYRTTSWIPVTVSVLNSGDQSYHGQIQVLADPIGPQGQTTQSDGPTEVFAVPATIPPSQGAPLRFTLYARDLDPTRDNFTVQFAEGDRGDGRVIAKIVSSANYHVRPFTGTAIPPGDLFIVGVGSDPIGAGFLSGQRLGLRHTPAGVEPEMKQPPQGNHSYPGAYGSGAIRVPTAQSVAAQPSELPDSAAGYRGVDALLIGADAALDSLSDAQVQAIQQWTLSGGRLVVFGGSGAGLGNTLPAALQQLLPARYAGTGVSVTLPTGPAMATRMIPTGAASAKILQSAPDGTPLMLAERRGAGSVLMLAYDPTSELFRQWAGASERGFWRGVVTGSPAMLPYAMQREERGPAQFYGADDRARISDIVLHVPQLQAPGVWSVAIFLGLYIIVLVPLNYFILKKMDRREWAWVTIPVLVVLVSAGAYGVGYAAKGGSLFVNRATLLETSAGASQAAAYSGCGLFSSHRAFYDIDFSNPTAIAADPAPKQNYYRSWADPSAANVGGVRYVATGSGMALRGAGVNMWSMRTFDVQSSVEMGGAVDAALRRDPATGELVGTVANHTPYALDDCGIYWRGQFSPIKTLAPGASAAVATTRHTQSVLEVLANQSAAASQHSGKSADSSTSEMKRALAALVVSTTQPTNPNENNYGFGYDPEAVHAPFSPGADEAMFVGWSADGRLAGPPLKVDGQTATQNDVTLVVVHIPVQPVR